MVVNRDNEENTGNVEFVSYDGDYPNLCRGELTLKICGETAIFGHYGRSYDIKTGKYTDGHYDVFWKSGGSCGFKDGSSGEYINTAEWVIDVTLLPERFKKYAEEIDEVFNANVPHGCCGGCL